MLVICRCLYGNFICIKFQDRIYPGCQLTPREAKLLSVVMSLSEHLSNESWDNILEVIDMHLPQPFHKNK